ncbi:MAG: PAS domain S-box protein, partial [Myxococcales bacterium]
MRSPKRGSSGLTCMRRIGVRSFLFVTLSLVSAAPVVWLGTVEASRLGRIAVNEANRRVRELGLDISRSVGNHVNEQVRNLSTLAAQIEPSMLGNSAYLQRVLDGLFKYTNAYAAVYVGDERGLAIASAPVLGFDGKPNAGTDYRDRAYFQQLLQHPQVLVSGVDTGRRTNKPSLHIVAPLLKPDHSLEAYIGGSVSLESIRQVILSCFEADSGAEVVLVDENSRLIADSRARPRPYLTDVSTNPLLRWSGSTERRIAPDESGRAMRASVVPVLSEYVRWDVIVFRPEAETESAAHSMRLSTLRVSLWALLGALLVSYISSRKFAKPITDLVNAAKQGTVASNRQALSDPGWSVPQELVELSTAVDQLLLREHGHKASLNELVLARTEELEAANQQLAVLAIALENAGDAICMTDAEGKIEWTNPGFRRITGYFPGESVGKPLATLLGIKGPFFNFGQRIEEQIPEPMKTRKSGLTWRNPVRSRVRDGAELDLDVAISPVTDDKGHPTRYVAVARDVTAQRRAAQEIADSEARYRTLVEHAPEAVVVLDTEAGHFVDCNVRAEELFRRVRQHLLRTDIVGLSPELQPDGRKSAPAIHTQL